MTDKQHDVPEGPFAQYQSVIRSLVGQRVTRLSVRRYSISVLIDNVEFELNGEWSYTDRFGCRKDEKGDVMSRQALSVWKVVGKDVSAAVASASSPYTLTITMCDGSTIDIRARTGLCNESHVWATIAVG